jgi:succinoglycan biosynthesis transport protein ExoP
MDLNQFLLALRARRKAFMLVFAATIITAVAVALLVPKRYVATTTLLIDARDEQQLAPTRMSPRERAGYIYTQVDLLQSGRVAARVARDLKLAQKPGMREAYESEANSAVSIDDWIAAGLLEKLKVDTSASSVITVTYASNDPQKAADVANGFAKAYLQTTLELRTEPSREAAEWFEDQLKGLRTQMTQAQTKLVSYQKAKGITYADERTDVDSARLTELSSQYLAAKNATYDSISRYKNAQEIAAKGVSVDSIPEVLSNPHITSLKVDLARAEGRREQESTVLGDNHPVYLRTVAEVQGIKEKIQVEMKKLVVGLGNAVEQNRRREDELKAAMAAQAERINSLKDYRIELAALNRDVESAQRTYDSVLTRYTTNKIESAAKMTNVALLTPAVVPVNPAHPKVGLITILAVVVGALFAAAVVYVLETIDRRVRSRADLESRLAVPSLGRLSKWQPTGARLLPAPALSSAGGSPARALPHPW